MKYIFIIVFLLVAINSNAQFKFGFVGGLNSATLSGEGTELNSTTGFHVGLMNEVKLPAKLGFELDLLYSTKGASEVIVVNSNGDQIGDASIKLSYLDVPLVAKLYMLKVTNLQLGAQYSILLSADAFTLSGQDPKELFNSGDISAVVGFGVDVSKFHAALRYTIGLSSVSASGGDLKNNVLMISLGYWLKK